MKVHLESKGKEFVLDIPFDVSEITFRDFISFTALEKQFFEELENNKAETKKEQADLLESTQNAYMHLLEACSKLVKGDLSALNAPTDMHISDKIKNGFKINLNDEITILELYAHLVNLINSFEPEMPESIVYEWDGRTYQIDKDEAVNGLLNTPLTAGEVVTALEFQKRAIKVTEQKGDAEGNLAFALGLREFALLMRRPGERLPFGKKQLEKFILQRVKIFEKLPMDIVLTVRFFLLSGIIESAKTRQQSTFSTPQSHHPEKHPNKETTKPEKGKKRNIIGIFTAGKRFWILALKTVGLMD